MNGTQRIALGLGLGVVVLLVAGNLPRRAPIVAGQSEGTDVVHATTAGFPAMLAQGKPVLVDFWAPWCGPCRTQGPILERFASQVGDSVLVAKVNVDEERALAAQYGVHVIPTLIVLRNGKEQRRLQGVQSVADLLKAVN